MSPRRTWRDEPATAKQLEALKVIAKQFGWAPWRVDAITTKGEAAAAITAADKKRGRADLER